jgi:hypothetical protein
MNNKAFTHLQSVCNDFNNEAVIQLINNDNVNSINKCLIEAVNHVNSNNSWCRMSSIGKPSIITGVNKLLNTVGKKLEPFVSPRLQTMFLWGNTFEAWILSVGELRGWWSVVSQQNELTMGIMHGHLDAVVSLPGIGEVVLEIKTLSPNYCRLHNKQPGDDRGYLTQLSLYTACSIMDGYWITLDKGSGIMSVVELNDEIASEKVRRAKLVSETINDLNTVEDVVMGIPVPAPTPEVYQRKSTGMFLIPESMKYSGLVDCFYETTSELNGYGKLTTYVVDFLETNESIVRLELLIESLDTLKLS